jgi:hypothetical protein
MPVDFCLNSGVLCNTTDVVTPFVWGQYTRPTTATNSCKDVIGNYLRTYGEGVDTRESVADPDDVLGLRDVVPIEHGRQVASWLGRRSGSGVAGKAASNLFMVFVEVIRDMAI